MKIRAIVVDNSIELKEKLSKILEELEQTTLCGSFDDAISALEYLEDHQVDLVFSDVVMPQISGITMAKKLYAKPVHPEVVLLSGIPGFSLDAWKIQAFGFIIKPYTKAQIVQMVHSYEQKMQNKS